VTEPPADQYRDPAAIAECTRVAGRVLARHGIDLWAAHRGGGWSNVTWLAEGLVLRIAIEPGSGRLLREARLASILPPEAGYPSIVDAGVTGGLDWVLSTKIEGRNLGEVWPTLGWEDRAIALRALWDRAGAIHSVDPTLASTLVDDRPRFYAPGPAEAAAQLGRLQEAGVLAASQVEVLSNTLDRFWAVLSLAPRVLNHGDLCTENALWNDGKVVALLDLEYAVLAPVELDLNEVVKVPYAPPERPDPHPDPGGSGQGRLRQVVNEIASDTISTPGGADRLLGYALLLDMWMMENELSTWDGREPWETLAPFRALTWLADGRGCYLAPLLARLGWLG
jgi:aminoglycoside phosphotransferase (APT) family kinase protein